MSTETSDNRFSGRLTLIVCLMVCGALSRLPDVWVNLARKVVFDVAEPATASRQFVEEQFKQRTGQVRDRMVALEQRHAEEKASWEHELRRRELELAKLRGQPSETLLDLVTPDRLFSAQLVDAEILSGPQIAFLQHHLLISNENDRSIETDQLVLQETRTDGESGVSSPIVDLGTSSNLQAEQPVFAGQCVVGMVETVGRYVSRIRLITDARYRGRARIMRKVEDGYAYGPEGVLEGEGNQFCLLRYISKTESVRVGDDVYTLGPTTSTSAPMYYGKIVEAKLDENAHEWSIRVKPGYDSKYLSRVQILNYELPSLQPMGN